LASTSGTVATTVFNTRKVIDRAFGRCRISPQQINPEYIDIAKDLLYLYLSTLSSKGLATFCIEKIILPVYDSVKSVPCPDGTVDVLNANLRTLTQISRNGNSTIPSASSGVAANAFDNDLATACTQVVPGGFIQVKFSTPSQPTIFGVLPNASGTWALSIQTSDDGVTWETFWSESLSVSSGAWIWVDIEGIPEAGVSYVRLQAGSATVLNVTEFVCGTRPNEIPLAKVNRDDYANLPDKDFAGRPVEFWYNKQFMQPVITLWPVPQLQFTYAQIVCYIQQQVEDVGTMTQQLAIPQRWFLAVITELARQLAYTIPEVEAGVAEELGPEAARLINEAWGGESDGSPTYLRPMIRNYTR